MTTGRPPTTMLLYVVHTITCTVYCYPVNITSIMKMGNFQGDLTDI